MFKCLLTKICFYLISTLWWLLSNWETEQTLSSLKLLCQGIYHSNRERIKMVLFLFFCLKSVLAINLIKTRKTLLNIWSTDLWICEENRHCHNILFIFESVKKMDIFIIFYLFKTSSQFFCVEDLNYFVRYIARH